MYKLIDSASFFPEEEPTINIIDPGNVGGLVKAAADSRITEFVSKIDPKPGKIYLHVNAMGASEYYGSNRNGDSFPEKNLLEYYKTFETSPAHVFRNHINKNPEIAIGKVILAIYNERMHRVELIAEVDQELGQDIENKLSLGQYPSTSMACRTPYDICSICGNKASSRQAYCSHLATMLNKMLPDGRKVSAVNAGPLKFFDISIVIRPADVTSSVLQKVAYDSSSFSSAELAEAEGISDERIKTASFKKLSEFIKEIEDGHVISTSPAASKLLSQTQDPAFEVIEALSMAPLPEVLDGLAELGISPSIKFLAELIARKTLKEEGTGLGEIVEELLAEVGSNNIELPNIEFGNKESSPLVLKALSPHVGKSSLFPEFVEKRASELGYAVLSNHMIPRENPRAANLEQKYSLPEMIKALLTIGGAALLAKWYITKSIEEKLATQRQNNVKIILTKKASDNKTVIQLSKVAMEQAVIIKDEDNRIVNADSFARKVVTSPRTNPSKKLSAFLKAFALGKNIISNDKEA